MAKKIKFPRGPFLDPDIEHPSRLNRERIGEEHLLPVKGNTPFGRYDPDPEFRKHAKKFSLWAARRLGWPEMSIEIDERDFYSALEEAIDEFSRIVNNQNIEDNLEAVIGSDADKDLTGRWVSSSGTGQSLELAKDYGSPLAAGAGGNIDWHKGFIKTEAGRQVYDKTEIRTRTETSEDEFDYVSVDEDIVIYRIFHEEIPSSVYGFHGFSGGFGSGLGRGAAISGMGLGGLSGGRQYTLSPLYDNALSMQDIELKKDFYQSERSFQILGDKVKIFPAPRSQFRIWVEFVYENDALGVEVKGDSTARANVGDSINNVISDYSDAPYDFIPYRYINAPGKRWIYKYGLEVARHKLGTVRSKFSETPSPQDSFQLDGQDLKQEAQDKMQTLVDNLKEQLDKLSKEERIRRKAEMAENLNKYLSYVPTLIYRD